VAGPAVADLRAPHRNRPDPRLQGALGAMSVAHDPPPPLLSDWTGPRFDRTRGIAMEG